MQLEATSEQPRTQALLPTPGAAAKTLVGADDVSRRFCGVNSKYILGRVAQERVCRMGNFKTFYVLFSL